MRNNLLIFMVMALVTTRWREEYGPHFQFRGLFNKRELYMSDTKALNHIPQTPTCTEWATSLFGSSMIFLGMRRILNPAFGTAQIRRLTDIFVERSLQLRDAWSREIKSAAPGDRKYSARIDITEWVRRATLDIIGHAGFNYQFNALEPQGKPHELNQAFVDIFHSPNERIEFAFRAAQARFPFLRCLPLPGQKTLKNARATMSDIGHALLLEGKAAVMAAGGDKDFSSRDLFSLLLKANIEEDVPGKSRLSDKEVVAQIPAFFVAGHETTSTAITWALYALSQSQSAQNKLREELMTVSTDNPTMEELNALPYLENVVRETLRVHTPLVSARRMVMVDDVLPLSIPYTDPKGIVHDSLPNDRPERWDELPEAVKAIPSVWSNLMTFFAGPHSCIGFCFSVAEQKALLFTLIQTFEFELAIPASEIGNTGILQRPFVLAERSKGDQMPMIVKFCTRA
ncbi:cytochrome P450 [Mycena rebaudengoi]|nr:cytochrome P450 [Mycena rebaudengoi]